MNWTKDTQVFSSESHSMNRYCACVGRGKNEREKERWKKREKKRWKKREGENAAHNRSEKSLTIQRQYNMATAIAIN